MIKNRLPIHIHDKLWSYLFIFMIKLCFTYSCLFTLFIKCPGLRMLDAWNVAWWIVILFVGYTSKATDTGHCSAPAHYLSRGVCA